MTAVHDISAVRLTLFRRPGCHLCDLAAESLLAAGVAVVDEVELGWEGALAERYGERIPVLRREDSGAELDWPFDAHAIRGLIGA